jgi:LmbE family N-acetylglucosaminyl deacetylase
MTQPRHPSVLAVYAHPDDEVFHGGGMLAHLSDSGVRVTLACATRGEAGKAHPSVGPVSDLGALRSEELRRACSALGLPEPRFLGFRDSARKERQRHDDPRALANVDMLVVEQAIRALIDEVLPHAIVTFDPHGGYYHPDHIAVHRAATAAFLSSGVLGSDAPARLFYSVFSQDQYRAHADLTRGWGVTDGLDPDVFAVAEPMIALRFDARPYMERKLRAFAAHQSAFGLTTDTLAAPPEPQATRLRGFLPIMEEENFAVGGTRLPIDRWPLQMLLDGIDTDAARP